MSKVSLIRLFVAGLLISGMLPGGYSQDAFMSQYWLMPGLVNPAEVGLIETDYRAVTTYRNQWASVSSPFSTTQAAFDTRFRQKGARNNLGLGGFVRSDRVNTTALNVFEASVQAAYHIAVNRTDYFGLGLSAGYRQRSINFDDLAWDSQFNGVAYDPALPSGELFTNDSKGNLDAAFGFHYRSRGEQSFDVGYAAWHYFQNHGLLTGGNDRLIVRHQVSFSWQQRLDQIALHYDLLGGIQGGAQMLMAGARLEYRMGNDSRYTDASTSNSIFGGVHYRLADAVVISTGFRYKRSLTISAAYDITLSRLGAIATRRGAWEIGLTWEGWYNTNRLRLR